MLNEDHMIPLVLTNILGVAGIIVWHLQGSDRPTGRLIAQILFFIGMSLVLYLGGISPHRVDGAHLRGFDALLSISARILWWTHLAWAIIGLVHIYMLLNRRPREAHLIQDMAVGVIYLAVALSIIGFVFGVPVGRWSRPQALSQSFSASRCKTPSVMSSQGSHLRWGGPMP